MSINENTSSLVPRFLLLPCTHLLPTSDRPPFFTYSYVFTARSLNQHALGCSVGFASAHAHLQAQELFSLIWSKTVREHHASAVDRINLRSVVDEAMVHTAQVAARAARSEYIARWAKPISARVPPRQPTFSSRSSLSFI